MVVVPTTHAETLERAIERVRDPFWIVERGGAVEFAEGDPSTPPTDVDRVLGYLPPVNPEQIGSASFRRDHGLKYAYVSGAMANGIGSVEIAEAMGKAGMLGIFGAAGLPIPRVEAAITRLQSSLGNSSPFGFNLIHSPNEPDLESAVVDLYLKHQIRLVEASAYLDLTSQVVRYRAAGLRREPSGTIVADNKVMAKVSRVEVAAKFLAPAPSRLLKPLVESGQITPEQANWAEYVPMADDLTAEADSGGHTDNQAAIVLIPTMISLRNRLQREFGFDNPVRIGAAGGIATPWSATAAFAMGADYLVVGSVHQSCVESGTSDTVRTMLCQAQQADIAMAPAADMFEMGVKVQVLKRGTMFAMRAAKLYELYRSCESIDQIPATERASLEKTVFRAPLATIWEQTRSYFERRDPRQIERAEREPRHKMALCFRWYLGQSSHWANSGEVGRAVDYQVWCGPAMAAFNEWVKGSELERPESRHVADVARNLLYGAAVLIRAQLLQVQGIALPASVPRLSPLSRTELDTRLAPFSA